MNAREEFAPCQAAFRQHRARLRLHDAANASPHPRVRVALGARSADVMAMVLGHGLRMVLLGVVIGVAGSLAVTRAIQSLLFGVSAADRLTFVVMILLLISAALLARYIPARRAARVDPMVAFGYE